MLQHYKYTRITLCYYYNNIPDTMRTIAYNILSARFTIALTHPGDATTSGVVAVNTLYHHGTVHSCTHTGHEPRVPRQHGSRVVTCNSCKTYVTSSIDITAHRNVAIKVYLRVCCW
jgi:hypothetical protein